jgi:hypothetical protein
MARRTTSPNEATTTGEDTSSSNESGTTTDSAAKPRQRRTGQKGGAARSGTGRGRSANTTGTSRLIEALLRSRGAKGATEADLEQVIRWAEGIRTEAATIETEAAELRRLGPRGKRSATGAVAARQKQQRQEKLKGLEQRRQRHAMDQALLAGVLDGTIAVDVASEGRLLFLHKDAQQQHAAASSTGQDGPDPTLS